MRILLVHNNFSIQGGAEVFFHEVGRILSAFGHEVAFFSAAENETNTLWSEYFPEVSHYDDGNFLVKAMSVDKLIYNRKAKAALTRLIEKFKPDLIHAFAVYVKLTPAVLDAAREKGVPVVMSCNDYKHICTNYKLFHHGKLCDACKDGHVFHVAVNRCCHGSFTYSIASMMEAYTHRKMNIYKKNVHTFLFASEFMARKTEEFWSGNDFRWRLLRNPFNVSSYLIDGKVGGYALYFGRLIDEKGVDILLDASAKVPEVPLIVIGEGPDMVKLKNRVQDEHMTHVSIVGPKWGEDLEILLKDCRFVVVPSLWHENFPYVILQAFAAGKPVIGSNRGGIPEMVTHEQRGLIYNATDVDELASAMRFMVGLSDKEILNMGKRGKDFVQEEFSDEIFYEHLLAIYEEVLS